MKNLPIPLPKVVGWEVDFLFWLLLIVIGILLTIALFLLVRFIQKNDEHHEKMEKAVSGQAERIGKHTTRMGELATQMEHHANRMKCANLKFQEKVNDELLQINKTTSHIKIDLSECTNQVGSIKKEIRRISDTVKAHNKSLSLSVQAMGKQREEMVEIQSSVRKLHTNFALVGGENIS